MRVYSASPNPERAKFTFGSRSRTRLVDLAGCTTKRAGVRHSRDGSVTLELRPFEILTFEVRRRAPKINSSFDRQKY